MSVDLSTTLSWTTATGDAATMLGELQPNILKAHVRDHLSAYKVQAHLKEDFLLDVSIGFIFDWDCVIIDSHAAHEESWGLLFAEIGQPMPGDFFKKIGYISANHENADDALRSGGLVVVFPGGDYDVYRPTFSENKIDFGGRTGYVKAALNAGVPIVPTVGIGGQETQIFLSRGTWLAERLGPIARLARAKRTCAKHDPCSYVGRPWWVSKCA